MITIGKAARKVKVILNETTIDAINFYEETVTDRKSKKELQKVKFNFQVSSSIYHDITTLLYKNDFDVKVPEKNLEFKATIHNYSTSITNLYNAGEVGEFYLELVEKT